MIEYLYPNIKNILTKGQDIWLLIARLCIAYGFYTPAISKWSDMHAVAVWFGSLGIPLPTLNAYLAATTELLGVVLLSLGLFTRVISLPLIFVMIVAIITVHLPNGFQSAQNGFEIPLYYMIFLGLFASFGAGRFSLDYLIFGKEQ